MEIKKELYIFSVCLKGCIAQADESSQGQVAVVDKAINLCAVCAYGQGPAINRTLPVFLQFLTSRIEIKELSLGNFHGWEPLNERLNYCESIFVEDDLKSLRGGDLRKREGCTEQFLRGRFVLLLRIYWPWKPGIEPMHRIMKWRRIKISDQS